MSIGSGQRGYGESHFPADGSETGGDLGVFVRGYVNLQIGQGVKVVEQAPVLPTSCQNGHNGWCKRRMGVLGFGYRAHGGKV
jgi:hypothetical protein